MKRGGVGFTERLGAEATACRLTGACQGVAVISYSIGEPAVAGNRIGRSGECA